VAISRLVRRRPVVTAAGAGTVLLLAAAPFLGARYADPDARSLPASSQSRQLAEIAGTRFDAAAAIDPITVISPGTVPAEQMAPYLSAVQALDGVRDVAVRTGVPGLTVIDVLPQGETQGTTAMRLVHDLRALASPAPVEVTGDAAELADYQQTSRSRLPWALGTIVAATFLLLFLFTGSIVVPAKAVIMNTLSLGASFGALVWVFQDGHLGALVGTQALGSLSITTPMLVFAISFGLSMDYEVFLLGRIAETYRRTGDTDLAVEQGLQHTGRIVTAAALVMAVIFAGFVAGGFSPVKQIGLGLLLAVLVDATVVRMLLMPAVMTLMGKANWWAPRPLSRLHSRIGLTDSIPAPAPAQPSAPAAQPAAATTA
jgi:RND superfamily putative drug exporter